MVAIFTFVGDGGTLDAALWAVASQASAGTSWRETKEVMLPPGWQLPDVDCL